MNKPTWLPIINLLATVVTIAVNGLANALPINGQTTGAISDRFAVYFVPAGYVFSIWGLIYLALIAFTIYQILPPQWGDPHLGRIGYLYAAGCAANVLWILLWHFGLFVPTLVVMLVLLSTLIAIYLRLGIGGMQYIPSRARPTAAQRWLVHVPFSIYLGWITVATIANATVVLSLLKWGGWGLSAQLWAIIMLLTASAITVLISFSRRDVAYALVIVWAFFGIAVKQAGTLVVAVPAVLLALALIAVTVVVVIRQEGTSALPPVESRA